MSYLDMLKAQSPGNEAPLPTAKTDKTNSVSFVSTPTSPVSPELRRLIERVALYFKAPPEEVALMLEIAARDPLAASDSFEGNARLGWIE